MQIQVVSGYEPQEILDFRQAQERLSLLVDMGLTQSMYFLTMCEYLDGDITLDTHRIGGGIIRIHRVAVDTFTVTEDEV